MNMLEQWAAHLEDRRTISEFFEWLLDKYSRVEGHNYLYDINIEKELDEFHGIDQLQLDKERWTLLEQCRTIPMRVNDEATL